MPKGNAELLIYILKEFTPIEPFYTNYLLEKKKFTTAELSNRAAPVYFIMSFSTILFTLFIINTLNFSGSLLFVCFSQIILFTILYTMKERDFFHVRVFYGLSGAISTLDSTLRNLIISEQSSAGSIDVSMAGHKVLRAIVNSIACWLGQDIFYKTHSHDLNISVSFLSLILCICISIFSIVSDTCLKSSARQMVFKEIVSAVTNISFFTLLALSSSIFAGCVYVFTNLFSHNIFNEKSKRAERKPSNLNYLIFNVLNIPISIMASAIIYVSRIFSRKFKNPPIPDWAVASGSIEGFSGIFCPLFVYFITKTIPLEYKADSYSILLLMASVFLYFLTVSSNQFLLYALHSSIMIASMASDCIAKSFIQSQSSRASLLILASLCESIIHISINFICRRLKVTAVSKGKLYSSTGLLCALIVIVLSKI